MFERFTERARQVVVVAQDEARWSARYVRGWRSAAGAGPQRRRSMRRRTSHAPKSVVAALGFPLGLLVGWLIWS